MKILIAGGTGLVGKELGKKLTDSSHEVFVLSRSPEGASWTCPYPQIALDWESLESHPAIPGIDAIINLAGTSLADRRWDKKLKEELYTSRIQSTARLVEVANRRCQNLQCFISASAVGIYGNSGDLLVDEDQPHSYSFLGKLCQDWEAALTPLQNGRKVIFRTGIVLSEKGGALEKIVTPIQSGMGGYLGNGQQFMSWIDIDDLVNMYLFALENPINGVFNAVAPNPVSNRDFSKTIADHLGVKLGLSIPYFAIRIAVGEMARYLMESQRVSSAKIQNKGFQFQFKKLRESIEARVPQLHGLEHRLIFEQWINKSKEELFPFFSDVKNLAKITPEHLNFQVLSSSSENVGAGTEFKYKLKIKGFYILWTSKIMEWDPPHQFIDQQEKGPYKKWRHLHQLTELAGGTVIKDVIDFEIPLGAIGYGATSWMVTKDLHDIFHHRLKAIDLLFRSK